MQKFANWLVFLFYIYILSTKYERNHNGIYRYDGLACFEKVSGLKADRIRKDFINIFRKEFQLSIVCVTTAGKYKPYNKPGIIPLYINVKSIQQPNSTKNLPESISHRINKLSSDKSAFDNSKNLYNNALPSSGFKDKIKFNPDFNKNISRNKNRKRKIIWFNPLNINNVSTNIGKSFLTILDRHFPKSHKLYKIFNRNNVKISYSSLPNFASIIN